ncbi:hypothetical protein HanRHA438_Chr04g0190851 [Helianthus annuus]|nr:hypothetical protein HanHA300_Chr04g0148131 [Helianthus annuus]KAJ0590213.1 hypothetical protein HanIR_Chr04g0194891 [Helianthus annuus]KAJ0598051.1 hypothetical protein HanHA89_Chr04g0161521 [Helianthus annuus]KAJ0762349.1 hypothetical protein HanOQP8_Chr04g0160351 [Helianthus annuus]KAJ0928151.1 hypothetical protein HanRHA438_Chr04g0190851 [Helianthus annuus]
MKSRRWTFDQSYQWQLQEYAQKIQTAEEASGGGGGGALPPISDGGALFSFRFTNQTNVQPAFPAFNTAAATTSIFTRAYIPQPNQFTFGAAAQIENAPQNLVSSGPNSVNPNATDVWVLNFCFLACDILLSTIEQYMHPGSGMELEERLLACLCMYNYTFGRETNSIIRGCKRVTQTPFEYNVDGRGIAKSCRLLYA